MFRSFTAFLYLGSNQMIKRCDTMTHVTLFDRGDPDARLSRTMLEAVAWTGAVEQLAANQADVVLVNKHKMASSLVDTHRQNHRINSPNGVPRGCQTVLEPF